MLTNSRRGTACPANLCGRMTKMSGKPALKRVRVKTPGVWSVSNHLMSQNQPAHAMDSTSGRLSQLLNGQRYPSPKMRRRLLEALGNPPFDEVFIFEDAHD